MGQTPFDATLTVAALGVACLLLLYSVRHEGQNLGVEKRTARKVGGTEHILPVVLGAGGEVPPRGRLIKLGMALVCTNLDYVYVPMFFLWYIINILGPEVTTQFIMLPPESCRLVFNRNLRHIVSFPEPTCHPQMSSMFFSRFIPTAKCRKVRTNLMLKLWTNMVRHGISYCCAKRA